MQRLLISAAIGLALLLGSAVGGYLYGRHAERQAEAARWADGLVRSIDRAARIGQAMAEAGQAISVAVAESHTREVIRVRTVREVIAAHPEFGALQRPAELAQLRHEDLQAITEEAAP